MISKGTTHNDGAKLARYMTSGKDGERAELWELHGFGADNIVDAFRDVHIMAEGTKCEQPFFHVQVRNPAGETLTREQWRVVANRHERKLGLTGQPRAIAFHIDELTGHEHMHIAWSRIDDETMTAKPLPFFKERLKRTSRELELHFKLTLVRNERDSSIEYAPTRAEDEQARRIGVNIHEVRQTIRDCYERSDCGSSFQAALEHEGLTLAQGDKYDFIVIDHAGGIHAIGKRILGVSAAQTRDRLADLARDELPTVEQARMYLPEYQRNQQQQKPEPVWDRDRDEMAWQDAVINAAIEKEKAERQFVEPRTRETRAGATSEREQPTQEGFTMPGNLRGAAAHIWTAWRHSDNARAFAAALDEHAIALAAVRDEEAHRSHIAAAYPKAIGNFAPEYRAGEIVAVTERCQVYQFNRRTTGKERDEIEAFLAPLDRSQLQGIEATKQSQQQRVNEKHWPAMAPQPEPSKRVFLGGLTLNQAPETSPGYHFQDAAREAAQPERAPAVPSNLRGPAADIWTAYNIRTWERENKDGTTQKISLKGGRDPYQFAAALEEKAMTLGKVTKQEADRSRTEADHWKKHGEWRPTYREGEFVAITQGGQVHTLNKRTTGQDPKQVQSFLEKADWKGLYGIDATKEIMQDRAAQRAGERQAIRDDIAASRLERATSINASARTLPGKAAKAPAIGKAAARALDGLLNIGGGLLAHLDTPKSPRLQERENREGERATDQRNAEAEHKIDFSKYTADRAQEQRNEQDRQAARDRERDLERDR